MASSYLVLATIIVLVILIVAYMVHRKEGFNQIKDAAPPLVRDHVNHMQALLGNYVAIWRDSPETTQVDPSYHRVAMMLDRSYQRLARTPRTYANCLAFYRGFCDSDRLLTQVADHVSVSRHPKNRELASLIRQMVIGCHNLGVALHVE